VLDIVKLSNFYSTCQLPLIVYEMWRQQQQQIGDKLSLNNLLIVIEYD